MDMINQIIETMKERLPNDPRTKSYFDKIVADGFTEEQAKDIMITAWLSKINGDVWMTEKEVYEICADISLKRMYLMLLKTEEMVLDINPQYNKKEILNYLFSIEDDIIMLNDKGNHIDRDLFK